MTAPTAAPGGLLLAAAVEAAGETASWIGPLLVLGSRVARYSRRAGERQLVIVVSVPVRDYAAALIGCGWVLASEAPVLKEPLETLRGMQPGQFLRAVNSQDIITGTFDSLNEVVQPPQVQFAGSRWKVDAIRAIAPLPGIGGYERAPRPVPGSIERMARLDVDWDRRLARPAADLAIVGTLTRLKEDLEASLTRANDCAPPSVIQSILMPKSSRSATWFTRVYASASLADSLPIARDVVGVILDGNSAVKYLTEIEAPVVVCVLDRSVADETAAEMVVQLRNTRGELVRLESELGWRPPVGVEALGFTVPL